MKNIKHNLAAEQDIIRFLFDAAKENEKDILDRFRTSKAKGLHKKDVAYLREVYGANKVTAREASIADKFSISLFIRSFMLACFSMSLLFYFIQHFWNITSEHTVRNFFWIIVLSSMSGLGACLKQIHSNKKTVPNPEQTSTVFRNSLKAVEVSATEIVCGDIIHLAAGDIVPADVRILTANHLQIAQLNLKYKQTIFKKSPVLQDNTCSSPLDCSNLAFRGSKIVSGSARAVVIATGERTLLNQANQGILYQEKKNLFKKRLASLEQF